ncbi:MAG TPA: homoserine O-succinyltransferase [Luteimonas sp.]|nr:homoserine O-succinyltransferase [Luteimonas sp.]
MSLVDSSTCLSAHEPPASPDAPDGDGLRRGTLRLVLPMRHAGLQAVALRWELSGPAHAPVTVLLGGISAHRHLARHGADGETGWAELRVAPGSALDRRRRRLLSFDYVGADGALDAAIDTADQADALDALLEALQVSRLDALVGYSYGALVGLQFAARHPRRLRRLVAVSGTHRAHPYASAWRALQRKAVALGQLQCDDAQGLSLARQFAMLAYRTPEEFAARFTAPATLCNGRVRVAAEDYLDAVGSRFAARTPPIAWLRLSESIDLHAVDPEAIARGAVATTVIAVEGDPLVPLVDAVSLVEGLGLRGRLRVLRSRFGHDAFLKEAGRMDALLAEALACPGNGR